MIRALVVTAAVLAAVVAVTTGCGSTQSATPVTVTVTTTASHAATTTPTRVESPAAKKVRLAKARRAKLAAAGLAKARAESAALEAVKRRANEAQANAWHAGYSGPVGPNLIYYKYPDRTCEQFATNGCWHVEIVSGKGCQYLEIDMNELQGGVIVGDLIANQTNVPPHTPAILELDADKAGVDGGPVQFTCTNY